MQLHFVSRMSAVHTKSNSVLLYIYRISVMHPEILISLPHTHTHTHLPCLVARVVQSLTKRRLDPFSGWGGVDSRASVVWAAIMAPPVAVCRGAAASAVAVWGRVRVVPVAAVLVRGGQGPVVSLWPPSWMAVTGSGSTLTAPWWIRTVVVPGSFLRLGSTKHT